MILSRSTSLKNINATHYENIPARPDDAKKHKSLVHAIIETPQGSPHKYALDAQLGIIQLREVLPHGMKWPFDYGFIPQTRGDDGDPLDVLFLLEAPTFSGCLMRARILGVVKHTQDGVRNDRFLSAPERMPGCSLATDKYDDIDDVPKSTLKHIESFLTEYSEREGHEIKQLGVGNAKQAISLIKDGIKAYKR
jgi:inorganic pyrophosphatase